MKLGTLTLDVQHVIALLAAPCATAFLDYLQNQPVLSKDSLIHAGIATGLVAVAVFDKAVLNPPPAAPTVPPAALLLLALMFCVNACTPAKAPTAAQARQDARAAVVTVEAAWMMAAQTCVDVAATEAPGPGQALLDQCAAVLDPLRYGLLAADDTINAWTDATSNAPLACRLHQIAVQLVDVTKILGAPPAVKTAAEDAVTVASVLEGSACPSESSATPPAPAGAP